MYIDNNRTVIQDDTADKIGDPYLCTWILRGGGLNEAWIFEYKGELVENGDEDHWLRGLHMGTRMFNKSRR